MSTPEFQRHGAPDPEALRRAIAAARRALADARRRGDDLAIVDHAGELAAMLTTARREGEALAILAPERARAEALARHEPAGWYDLAEATARQYLGERVAAEVLFGQALARSRAAGWRRLEGYLLAHRGRCRVELGRLDEARADFGAALAIRVEQGDPRQAAVRRLLEALDALPAGPGLVVEPAQPDDAPAIRALMARVIGAEFRDDPALQADTLANVEANLARWLQAPSRCVHLVARRRDGLAGVVLVRDFWNLCSLFVDDRFQGRGLGRQLVEAAATACRGRSPKGALWLNAAPGAIAFYRRLGFVERASAQPLPPGFLAMQRAP